jgi:RNA polymerase sigma factor (TIGR02999 family)
VGDANNVDRSRKDEITSALVTLRSETADRHATDRLVELLYDDLRRIAASFMRDQRPGHTLQPTAIVHEAYLKLVHADQIDWTSRAQFLSVASRVMRQVLIDHARRRNAQKRGGDQPHVALDSTIVDDRSDGPLELLALDQALDHLSEESKRVGRVAEMRIFAGMSTREIAAIEAVTERTIASDWLVARMWLTRQLHLQYPGT